MTEPKGMVNTPGFGKRIFTEVRAKHLAQPISAADNRNDLQDQLCNRAIEARPFLAIAARCV